MDKSKKFMYISIIILLISVVSSIGTYAWFTWTSTDNTSVTLSIGKLADVTFTSGPDINVNNLAPVFNYTDGESTTFSITNSDTSSQLFYRLKLNIDTISNELISKDFKYTLLKNGEAVYTGDFSSAISGSTMILHTGSVKIATSNEKTTANYTLYFWIDGNEENDPNMMSKLLKGTIEVGVESNILTRDSTNPSSGTSTFLNSTLTRESIESVNISGTNTEPSGSLGSFDVSKNQDNSIIMWYTDTDNDNLYEVTIGSNDNNTIFANSDSSYLFSYLANVTNLDINDVDTSAVIDMNHMFSRIGITNLDLSNFNTSNVTNMSKMFYDSVSLITLDVSSFDTSKVTDMTSMFYNCQSLTNLELSNFNTKNVTTMEYMFYYCRGLISIDLSSFDTSNVTNMNGMFMECRNTKNLNVSSFVTNNVTTFNRMFRVCSSLISLDLNGFTFNNATTTEKMFAGNIKLTNINLKNAVFPNNITTTSMFDDVPTNATIKLKDTTGNRTFMSSNFPGYTPTYIG